MRGKAERFADHYTQATLFWNSQTDVEKQHIINAFRFELSRVQTPAVRERMVSGLMNVDAGLAKAVAAGLASVSCRRRCPRSLTRDVTPEVSASPALSLFARPGDGSIRTRRVAILVADGCNGAPLVALANRLTAKAPSRASSPRRWARWRRSQATRSRSTSASRRRRRCCTMRWCCPTAPMRCASSAATGGRSSSSRISTATASQCWRVATAPNCSTPAASRPANLIRGSSSRQRFGRSRRSVRGAIAKHRHFVRETDPPRV